MFCRVPEVKVKIGHRFLLSLQGYISISHGSSSNTAPMCQPRTNGPTVPHDVSYNGHLDFAWFLVGHGVGVVVQDQSWSTLLHFASSNGRLDRFLVQLGANVAAQGKGGWTPFGIPLRSTSSRKAPRQ